MHTRIHVTKGGKKCEKFCEWKQVWRDFRFFFIDPISFHLPFFPIKPSLMRLYIYFPWWCDVMLLVYWLCMPQQMNEWISYERVQFPWIFSCSHFDFFSSSSFSFKVSTSTGVISHFVNLQVVVPEAFILGSGELHVDMGSAINLVCIIEKVRTWFTGFSSFSSPDIKSRRMMGRE